MFHGLIPCNIFDLKIGIRPQKIPSPNSEIPQDVLEQTETISQDVKRNAMQAYIKYKAYYDEKANASKLKQFCSQKQITEEVNSPLQIFGGFDHILVKRYCLTIIFWYAKLAPKKRKFCTEWGCANSYPAKQNQTYQWHHANGNQTRKLSLSKMIYTPEHGSVNTTIFDSDRDNMVIPNSPEVTVWPEEAADETRSNPGTIQEDSSEILPHTVELGYGTDTDHYMQPDADTSVEQTDPTPTNPRSSKYDLRQNPRPSCNDDYRY